MTLECHVLRKCRHPFRKHSFALTQEADTISACALQAVHWLVDVIETENMSDADDLASEVAFERICVTQAFLFVCEKAICPFFLIYSVQQRRRSFVSPLTSEE